jgi:hypothetical protein
MDSELPDLPPRRRKLLWGTFGFVFLGTPVFLLLAAEIFDRISIAFSPRFAPLWLFSALGGIVAAGSVAGFLFARLTTRGPGFLRDVIAFGFIFTLLIGVITTLLVVFWSNLN